VPSAEQIRTTLQTYAETFAAGDRARWLDLFAPDAVHIDPPTEPARTGHEAIGRFWDDTRSFVERFDITVRQIIPAGNEGVLSFTCRSHLAGGAAVELDIVDLFTIGDDGRITRMKAYFDMGGLRPIT
jgi:steroid delta-isomerase